MTEEEFDELCRKMRLSILLGMFCEEPGYLPDLSEEHVANLSSWLIGEGWVKLETP